MLKFINDKLEKIKDHEELWLNLKNLTGPLYDCKSKIEQVNKNMANNHRDFMVFKHWTPEEVLKWVKRLIK